MKNNIIMVLWMLLASLLSGCDEIDIGPPRPPRVVKFEIVKVENNSCVCGALAVRYSVKNVGERDASIKINRLERSLSSPIISSTPIFPYITKGESQLLDCSILPNEENKCDRHVAYEVMGGIYPDTPDNMAKETIISLVEDNLSSSAELQSTGHCVQKCVSGDKTCILIPATNSPDTPLGNKIALLIRGLPSDGMVAINKILALTKTGENTCGRTDLVTRHNSAYNYGKQCDIGGSISQKGVVGISVPMNLRFAFDLKNSGNFTMVFNKKDGAPVTKFEDPILNSYFGGNSVARIDYVDGLFIGEFYTTSSPSNCLAIKTF